MNAGRMYREGTVQGASPAALVARLYEQVIHDLRQALKALEQNDVELRTSKINHAILVIGYLESQLNFDAGGKVAGILRISTASCVRTWSSAIPPVDGPAGATAHRPAGGARSLDRSRRDRKSVPESPTDGPGPPLQPPLPRYLDWKG